MGYEWNMSGKKNHGILFWNVSLSSFKHSWKIPPFTSMTLSKLGWFFEAFLGQDVQLVFFGSWENDDKILDVVRCPFE